MTKSTDTKKSKRPARTAAKEGPVAPPVQTEEPLPARALLKLRLQKQADSALECASILGVAARMLDDYSDEPGVQGADMARLQWTLRAVEKKLEEVWSDTLGALDKATDIELRNMRVDAPAVSP